VNDWYLTDDYHQDHGEGADLYSVGKSRGCGGLGIYRDGKLAVSRNFVSSRVLANGPLRLVFELSYAPWDAGGTQVSETKRVVLDAGQNFDRLESSFRADANGVPLTVGIGIGKHAGALVAVDQRAGWLRSWEPLKQPNGNLGCAVVVPGGVAEYKETDRDFLVVTPVPSDGTVTYFAGFGWDRSGDFADAAAWARAVEGKQRELAVPVRIRLSTAPAALPVHAPLGILGRSEAARMAEAVRARAPMVLTATWEYDTGMVLMGIERLARKSKDPVALAYVKRTIDALVDPAGNIKDYRGDAYNIDDVNAGKVLFRLFADAQGPDRDRYRKAIKLLRAQMKTHPRIADGAFWHKKIYPDQMWLDGVYMASPFLAEYAATFHEPALFDEAARQIVLAERHLRDAKTGLLYHGWDARKEQRWADPRTGRSSQFWGRAMGWYAMAIVDVLEWLPTNHPQRKTVLGVLQRLAVAIARVQDRATGVWWQVLDQPERAGNYREASASSMFVYALSKAVHQGWLDEGTFGPVASAGYHGLVKEFVEGGVGGQLDLKHVCKVAGLGGTPYRDGSYAYYTGTEVVRNDPKGIGAFLLAAIENE
jgi:unsaturated rhamnogalacturonyl hydrolase